MNEATLFVVATPIGNLEDLSPRARQVLQHADLIAAEDTRHTGRLLSHFGIETPQISLHEHNEDEIADDIVARIQGGLSVALVSDAGTPLISDPGFRLLRSAHAAGIRVSPVPGVSAAIAALSVAGLPTDRFCFEGFLPGKAKARQDRIKSLARETRTIVCFESVHRIAQCLRDLIEILGSGRRAFIGRELTKMHEQCVSGTLGELLQMIEDGRIAAKGEFVFAIEGDHDKKPSTVDVDVDRLLRELTGVMPGSEAVALVASLTGRGRNEIYRLMIAQRDTGADD